MKDDHLTFDKENLNRTSNSYSNNNNTNSSTTTTSNNSVTNSTNQNQQQLQQEDKQQLFTKSNSLNKVRVELTDSNFDIFINIVIK